MEINFVFKPTNALATTAVLKGEISQSDVYKCLAENIKKFPAPNTVDVILSGDVEGDVGYTIIQKQDTFFITETYRHLDLSALADCHFPSRYLTFIEASKDDGSSSNKYKFYRLDDANDGENFPPASQPIRP